MGFETYKVYEISLSQALIEAGKLLLCVEEITKNDVISRCHYSNINSFLSNWKVNQLHLTERPIHFWSKKDYSEIKEIIMTDIRERKLSKILN